MKLDYRLQQLPLEFTFTISRSTQTIAETVLLELSTTIDGKTVSGIGEAVPTEFYGETVDTVMAFYQALKERDFLSDVDPLNRQSINDRLAGIAGNYAAKAAIDTACWDLAGKALNVPVYQLLGLDPYRAPKTSYTLGIADLPTFRHKTQTALARGYEILKVKLGVASDIDCLKLVRQLAPDVILRVDANAAWTLPQVLELMPVLEGLGVEFVEEPLRLDSPESDYHDLREQSRIPIMADESCHRLRDIPRCARLFHAVNLKLTKTGGLSETLAMIYAAKAHGLRVMLGCFTESSLAITAMAQLSPLVDFADLDGHLLVGPADPFDGVQVMGSQLILPKRPGIGVIPKHS